MLWWLGGFVALLAAILGILFLLKRKGPIAGAAQVVEAVQAKIDNVDLAAQIQAAKAIKLESSVIAELKSIQEIKDRKERLSRLAKLMEK